MSLLNNLRVLKNLTVGGNLDVQGTTTSSVTSISTVNLNVTDRHLYINKDHTTSSLGGVNLGGGGYVVNAKALLTLGVDDSSGLAFPTTKTITLSTGASYDLPTAAGELSTSTLFVLNMQSVISFVVSDEDGYYNGWKVTITNNGDVLANGTHAIESYDGDTSTATLATPLGATLDGTSEVVFSYIAELSADEDHTNVGDLHVASLPISGITAGAGSTIDLSGGAGVVTTDTHYEGYRLSITGDTNGAVNSDYEILTYASNTATLTPSLPAALVDGIVTLSLLSDAGALTTQSGLNLDFSNILGFTPKNTPNYYDGWKLNISGDIANTINNKDYRIELYNNIGSVDLSTPIAHPIDANAVVTLSNDATGASKTVFLPTYNLIKTDVAYTNTYFNGWNLSVTGGGAGEYLVNSYDGVNLEITPNFIGSLDATSALTLSQFRAGDFIQVSGSRDHTNDGTFMVSVWDGSLLTIKDSDDMQTTADVADFVQTTLTVDDQKQPSDDGSALSGNAKVTHIRVSVMRHNSGGEIVASNGDDEDELVSNQTIIVSGTDTNLCTVVKSGMTTDDLKGGVLTEAAGGYLTLDLANVAPKYISEVYLLDTDTLGTSIDVKLILPATSTVGLKENTRVRVIRHGSNSAVAEIESAGSDDRFDDNEVVLNTVKLCQNASKVDLTSSSCHGLVSTWYMG